MAKVSSSSSSGVGFLGLLACLFIGLKLTGHIDWSWWAVTAPLWGGFAFVSAIVVVIVVFMVIAETRTKRRKLRRL